MTARPLARAKASLGGLGERNPPLVNIDLQVGRVKDSVLVGVRDDSEAGPQGPGRPLS